MKSTTMKDLFIEYIEELISMDHNEFHKLLSAHESGDIAEFLMDTGAIEAMFPNLENK